MPLSVKPVLAACLALACVGVALLEGQPAPAARGASLTVLSGGARHAVPITVVNGREMVPLDALASLFDLTVREDAAAGGLTVSRRNRVIVMSTTQGLASVAGRAVSLPAAPARAGASWLVPIEFVGRALPAVVDTRLEFRRGSRLLVAGDLRVPSLDVTHEGDAQRVRVEVAVSPSTPHAVSQEAGRLTVAFQADALDATIEPGGYPDLLQGVRVVDGTTLVLDLGPRFASYRASDAPATGGAAHLRLELLAAAPPTAPGTTAAEPTAPAAPPLPPFEPPAAAIRTVVVDPGHGGDEHGAKGPGGTLEKDVALAVARQLKAVLEARLGVRVLLTREGDHMVPLDQRAAVANNNNADLFISLHANASVRSSVTGAEVYYLSLEEYGQDAAHAAEPGGEVMTTITGGQRQIDLILWDMAQARHLEQSAVFARTVEEQLRARVPMSARALQQAPFRVLVGANMPAVLIEMGFITNPDEEKMLAAPDRQAEIVQGLYESVVRFRDHLEALRGRTAPAAGVAPVPATPATPVAAPVRSARARGTGAR